MTARRNKAGQNEAAKQLAERILALLRDGPKTMEELREELGFSHHAIRARLLDLMAVGKVHFVEIVTKGGLGKAKLWCMGAASDDQLAELVRIQHERALLEASGSIAIPKQVTQREYPTIGRRDPLVAALFGVLCLTNLPQKEHACA